jgi:uncharacterized OsmC-like protein
MPAFGHDTVLLLPETVGRGRHSRPFGREACDATAVSAELTDEERARLLDIAERCPVHRALHSEVLISTTESAQDRRAAND